MSEGLELTPVAIQAGRMLVQRLMAGKPKITDYDNVPTTVRWHLLLRRLINCDATMRVQVFTPLEYGACGLAEEDAISRHGEDNIEVYHNVFNPLEHTVAARKDAKHCYAKIVCHSADDVSFAEEYHNHAMPLAS